ncbi:uncharacterized protein RAG0_03787 [Rhynchosporium agropyri]|uniref:Uncharacterized protein n=1 Tax=Rhynchosporium agropyri TaxID=914238 RepID=A0A1E1K608_9HELO|nr:uncharacterized protein RAG0_03787 [Rhynchosporium agropyri]
MYQVLSEYKYERSVVYSKDRGSPSRMAWIGKETTVSTCDSELRTIVQTEDVGWHDARHKHAYLNLLLLTLRLMELKVMKKIGRSGRKAARSTSNLRLQSARPMNSGNPGRLWTALPRRLGTLVAAAPDRLRSPASEARQVLLLYSYFSHEVFGWRSDQHDACVETKSKAGNFSENRHTKYLKLNGSPP